MTDMCPIGVCVIDPAFMLDLVHHELQDNDGESVWEEAYFAGARLDDNELRDAAAADAQGRAPSDQRAHIPAGMPE